VDQKASVDEIASKVGPAAIDIAYQRLGNPDAPVVLLIRDSPHNTFIGPTRFVLRSSAAACTSFASTIAMPAYPRIARTPRHRISLRRSQGTSRRCLTRSPIWLPMRWVCWMSSAFRRHMSWARLWEVPLRKPWPSSIPTVSALSPP
jgi:hypothetical protein